MKKYFVSCTIGGEEIESEVSLAEYCKAERECGFRSRMAKTDPDYMITPATAGFSRGETSGRISFVEDKP